MYKTVCSHTGNPMNILHYALVGFDIYDIFTHAALEISRIFPGKGHVWMWARTDFSGDLHCQFPTSRLSHKGEFAKRVVCRMKARVLQRGSHSYVFTSIIQKITLCIHDFFTEAHCSFSLQCVAHLSSSRFQLLFSTSSSILLLSLFCFIHVDGKIISCLSFNMESI